MKKAISLFLSLILIVGMIPAAQLDMQASAWSLTWNEFLSRLADVESQYPTGSQRTSWPKGSTCHGYARWISEQVWGSDFANGNGTGWLRRASTSSSSQINALAPGDVIRFRREGKSWNHTIFITSISGDTIYYTDCNSDGNSTIKWNQSISKSTMDYNLKLQLYDYANNETEQYGYIAHYSYNDFSGSSTLPTNVTLTINTTTPHIGETVEFISSAQNVDSYTIGINLNGTRIVMQQVTHYWYYKCETAGNYTAYISASNSNGSTDSNVVSFTVEPHNYQEGYERAHPHRVYMKCSCGAYYYTGETTTMPGCIECSRPNKASFVGLQSSYEEGENVTFNWSATTNTTHYNLVIERENDDGSYRTIYRKNYAVSGESVSFGEGYYRASVQSYNSQCWEEDGSDWVHIISDYSYFQVNKPVYSPVITPIFDDIVINESTHFIYGLPVGVAQGCVAVTDGTAAYEYPTAKQAMGTGTVVNIYNNDNDLVDSYTIVVFGDIDGDGWYDGTDAYYVSLLASGLIPQTALTEAQRTACDANHDGAIDMADVAILEQAGLLLNDIDQTAPIEELQTDSVYLEYCGLIDQSIEITEPDQPTTAEESAQPATQTVWGWLKALFTIVLNWLLRVF